jgi:hypothetical protein
VSQQWYHMLRLDQGLDRGWVLAFLLNWKLANWPQQWSQHQHSSLGSILYQFTSLSHRDLSLLHSFQISSGAYPVSYPLGVSGSFLGGKVAGAWSWPHISV